ncbi:MAG: ATP-binding protein [Candidatus Desulforudaceae bacterium]
MGLDIVKHIVEGHGGKVGVSSIVGRGTTFELLIPAQP